MYKERDSLRPSQLCLPSIHGSHVAPERQPHHGGRQTYAQVPVVATTVPPRMHLQPRPVRSRCICKHISLCYVINAGPRFEYPSQDTMGDNGTQCSVRRKPPARQPTPATLRPHKSVQDPKDIWGPAPSPAALKISRAYCASILGEELRSLSAGWDGTLFCPKWMGFVLRLRVRRIESLYA